MIRAAFWGAALAALSAGSVMAQEETRPAWTRFASSNARFEPAGTGSLATAYVNGDGKVLSYSAQHRAETDNHRAGACSAIGGSKPSEFKRMADAIARDEGVASDLVAAILKIELRTGAVPAPEHAGQARLTSGPRSGNEDCLPAVTLRAGIRRLKDLGNRYPERMHLLGAYHAGEDMLLASRGVPPSPETLRFIAEVLNDLAGGIGPREERRPLVPARRIAGVRSDPAPGPQPSPSRSFSDPRWASGFVLNIE